MAITERDLRKELENWFGGTSSEFKAVLGKADGTVNAGNHNVYVTLYNGQVVEAYNGRVPNRAFRKIVVGFANDYPRLLQVLRFDDIFSVPPLPYIPNHKDFHAWFSTDPVNIYKEQFLPLLPRAAGDLTIRVYSGEYMINGVRRFLPTTDYDLSGEAVSDGAEWVNIEIDDTGTETYNHGDNYATRSLLIHDYIPVTAATKKLLCSVKMYNGQSSFIQTQYDTDIYDPRFIEDSSSPQIVFRDTKANIEALTGLVGGETAHATDTGENGYYDEMALGWVWGAGGSGGTPGGSDTEVQYNDAGVFNGDTEFTWNKTTKTLHVGAATVGIRLISADGDVDIYAPDSENPAFISHAYNGVPAVVPYVAEGTLASEAAVSLGKVLWQVAIKAFNGTDYKDTGRIRAIAAENHDGTSSGMKWEVYCINNTTNVEVLVATFDQDGNINIAAGKEYRVNGANHEHAWGAITGTLADQTDLQAALNGWTPYDTVIPTRIVSPLDGTFTVTIATPAVFTKTAHGLITGSKIRLTTTGTLPTGLAAGTDYYVVYLTANTFGVATSLVNAIAETPTRVNTSGTQSGTHSIVHQTDPAYWMQFANTDLTSTFSIGMPVKWTQNSIVRYGFIATTPAFSTHTTFMVLMRCDDTSANYDLLDTDTYTVSSFYYGLPKLPGLGFPTQSSAWTINILHESAASKSSPTAGVTYNPANVAIVLPPGYWDISSGGRAWTTFPSASQRSVYGGCSSSQTAYSDSDLTYTMVAYGSSVVAILAHVKKTAMQIATETTLYHLVRTDTSGASTIEQRGASGIGTYITAISNFLF